MHGIELWEKLVFLLWLYDKLITSCTTAWMVIICQRAFNSLLKLQVIGHLAIQAPSYFLL